MKKGVELYFLIGATFIIAAGLLYVGTSNLWLASGKFADEYYENSQMASNPDEKILFLIKSNALRPSDEKNIAIASMYLSTGDFLRAQKYLNSVKSQEGYIRLAQSSLESGDFKSFDFVLPKIQDSTVKSELTLDKQALNGDFNQLSQLSSQSPLYLSRFLVAINTRNYDAILSEGALDSAMKDVINKNSGKDNQELRLADYLSDHNQPFLAVFLAERLISENKGLIDAYLVLAKSSQSRGDIDTALKYLESAIGEAPDRMDLYVKAISLAQLANQNELASYLNQRSNYLQKIAK
jgi:tetratricopeptide (TPR) repeat protein